MGGYICYDRWERQLRHYCPTRKLLGVRFRKSRTRRSSLEIGFHSFGRTEDHHKAGNSERSLLCGSLELVEEERVGLHFRDVRMAWVCVWCAKFYLLDLFGAV